MEKYTDDSFPSQESSSHLRLVVSNPLVSQSVEEGPLAPSQIPLLDMGLKAQTRKIGGIYKMEIEDGFHGLQGDFYLELEKYRGEWTAVCHVPNLFSDMNKFLEEDDGLFGIIAIQFQLKVLLRLFGFCQKHKASGLLLYFDNDQANAFEVYDNFLADYDDALDVDEYATQMHMPVNSRTLANLKKFVRESARKMEQGLWHDQQSNLAVRQYLKSRIRHEWESSLTIH